MGSENPYESPAPPAAIAEGDAPRLEPPQSVSATLHTPDYLAFVNHFNSANTTLRRYLWRRLARLLAISAALIGLSYYLGPQGQNLPSLEALARIWGFVIGVFALVQWPLHRWQSRRRIRANIRLGLYGEIDKETTVVLEDDGVRLRDRGGEAIRYWRAVEQVGVTDSHLFLYLQPMQAAIVPLRAFQSEGQFRGFAALANRLWSESQNQPSDDAGQ